jgi:hypothetical protein
MFAFSFNLCMPLTVKHLGLHSNKNFPFSCAGPKIVLP